MNRNILLALWVAIAGPAFAAEEDPAPPTNRPSPEELRGRFKNLTPEERDARLRELRGRLGPGGTNRGDLEKRREEWKKLPPAEREARLRELRERNLTKGSPRFNRLTPAERETKRSEIKARIDAQIKNLEDKRNDAPLTPADQRRLERFQNMARRLEQGTALGSPQRPGTNRPPRKDGAPIRPNP